MPAKKPTQVDLAGDEIPLAASRETTIRHRFQTDHFRYTVKDIELPALQAAEDQAWLAVLEDMKAKPDTRNLTEEDVQAEAHAIAAEVLKAKWLGSAP